MFPYILIFVITAVLALVTFETKKVSPVLFYGYVLALGVFVGISDMLGGYDRYIYGEVFTSMSEAIKDGKGIFNEYFEMYSEKEPLYGLINEFIGLFTPNRYIFILVFTLLVYAIYAYCFYKYTRCPFFSLMLFLGLMFFFTFTYLRQVLAVGFVWMSIPYVVSRDFKKFALLIFAATMCHNSAGFMFLLYFIPRRKFAKAKIIQVMTILFVIGLIGVSSIFVVGGEITGSENISAHANAAEYGFRIEYVIESVLFLIILLLNYDLISEDEKTLAVLNVYLMFCGALLFFCRTSDGGRLAWYGILGIVIISSELCKSSRQVPLRFFLTILSFVLYLRILIFWDIQLYPYKSFFSDGVRPNDPIYEQYEYDNKYKLDKFYNL